MKNSGKDPRLFFKSFSSPLGFVLVLFLHFPHISEIYLEKLTVSNSVLPLTLPKPNKKAIPAYPEGVLKGFLAYF